MKVLVVGGGGREHALVWKISQSPKVSKVYCAPGNAGISRQAEVVSIKPSEIDALFQFASKEAIDLTVVGPEDPLTRGIVDRFEAEGLAILGPSKRAAEIEGSKAFAKALMEKCGIPTGAYAVFNDPEKAKAYVRERGAPIVVKADGLAAGKGVVICKSVQEAFDWIDRMMVARIFGDAGKRVVIEEHLRGEEASFIALTDGKTILPLASSQDHKAVFDGDEGPNTGGMGAYSPAPIVTEALHGRIVETILRPLIRGMEQEGRPYRGVIYAGLMIGEGQPKVLEFNARLGDPETQPIFMRLKSDVVPVFEACIRGDLSRHRLEWDPRPSVCVVMASKGYPGDYERGKVIRGLEEVARMEDIFVFHAGTAFQDGHVVTSGGRVLGVTGLGENIQQAIERTYRAVGKITWDGVHYRSDIGQKALKG